ncbi:MAG: single-stranded DNA-binding protein [Bacilli bacterium]
MINRVVLVGRLSRNPEKRTTANNNSVVSFSVAVDNMTKGADGQKTTSFIPCVAWNGLADNIAKYTKKGSLVGVEGRIVQRSYKNNSGVNVQVVEIIAENVQFLSPKSERTEDSSAFVEENTESSGTSDIDIMSGDEDLPF